MPIETMTPKERWLQVITRRKPDRIPMDYWGTPEAMDKLKKYFGVTTDLDVFKKLRIDRVITVGPRYAGPKRSDGADPFGLLRKPVNYGTGTYNECINHPLAKFASVKEIEAEYKWPTTDLWDFSGIPEKLSGKEEYPIRGGGSEPFLMYKHLRGDEQAFVDLIENPELVHYILDKLYGLAYTNTQRIFETIPGKVNISYVAEDMGSQEDLMYSPAQIREYFIPWMTKMAKLVHDAGAYVIHHDDGAVRKIIPDLISLGVDILNPIQWRCRGMEREGLKKDFGANLIFHGGVDNQQTLPFGSVEDVKNEVIDNIRILGAGGGYILAPCHNIQPVTPVENIIAMYETGYEYGWVK
ncbi:MAG: uroporphyrinogen decarboxylase family protein [Elusimicrobiota bacterium]